jgi:hypothetical protein
MEAQQVKDRIQEGGNKVGIKETRGSNICFQSWSQISSDTSLKTIVGWKKFWHDGRWHIRTEEQRTLSKLKVKNWKHIWLESYFVNTPRNREINNGEKLFIIWWHVFSFLNLVYTYWHKIDTSEFWLITGLTFILRF